MTKLLLILYNEQLQLLLFNRMRFKVSNSMKNLTKDYVVTYFLRETIKRYIYSREGNNVVLYDNRNIDQH